MRWSELSQHRVVDTAGRGAGMVRDVRVEIEERADGTVARLRVVAVVAGHGALGERFGYAYGHTRGPWLLAALSRWLTRHARVAGWERVVSVADGRVVIEGSTEDLPTLGSLSGEAP